MSEQWVDVECMVPAEKQLCICYTDKGKTVILEYFRLNTWCIRGIPYAIMENIIYWMPVPEPPEEINV